MIMFSIDFSTPTTCICLQAALQQAMQGQANLYAQQLQAAGLSHAPNAVDYLSELWLLAHLCRQTFILYLQSTCSHDKQRARTSAVGRTSR